MIRRHAAHRAVHDLLDPGGAVRASLVSRLDPRARVVAAGLFALAVVALRQPAAAGLALMVALLAAIAAGLEARATLRRLAALDGLMVAALATLPFTVPGTPILSVGGFAATQEGLLRALLILLKANAVLLMVQALIGTIDSVALGLALRRLGAPEKLVQLYLFTIRYLDVLGREYRRLRLAMRARAFRMRADRHTWRSVGYLFGMLMVRSVERSERIVRAMRCRGFDGRFPSLDERRRLQPADGGLALATLAGLALLLAAEAA